MPIVFTFDLEGAPGAEYNRIQSFFERFGWQNLGGSSYRYPRLGTEQPVENWFNHVIPALMLFRAYILDSGRTLTKYTLDIQSSAGLDPETGFGTPPVRGNDINLYPPSNPQFGESNLREWLEEIEYAYPVGD